MACLNVVETADQIDNSGFAGSCGADPVSYTHLDVYKRQADYDRLELNGNGRIVI